ncbi:heparan-alpha-glucosaminide N-acetyltransferase domain-containing protein [Actinotalea sp. AC32]|nr:heparan-alpha-glucosaminide N-acetyltransferase domain-containing protein [Actinotalea sp. AC32]
MERVVGVDVARGTAVLGMFTAHVGAASTDWSTPAGWLQLADGRSAATFALLAGVAAALLSGGAVPAEGDALVRARVRITVRALLLWPVGALLIALGTPVAVILPSYAVLLAATTAVLRLPVRALLGLAAVLAVVAPVVVHAARAALGLGPWGGAPQLVEIAVGEYYPVLVWAVYVLVGLAVGRLDLAAPRTARRLVVGGAAAVVVGYGAAAVAARLTLPAAVVPLVSAEPHADTTPDVVGTTGVALLVLGVSLWATPHLGRVLAPLAATGALALTAYCTHLVAIAALGDDVVRSPSNAVLLAFVVVTVALAWLWRATLGRGPLERAMHAASTSTARALVP